MKIPFGIPLEKTKVTCEVAQKVNQDIVNGIHPEDQNLEAAVILHTLLRETCNKIFLALSGDDSTPKN